MSESTTVAIFVSSLSAMLLALLGVDYYSLLWSLVGSVGALLYSAPTSRSRAVFSVCVSMLTGAALGTALAEHLGGSRSVLIVASVVCATGPQLLINALLTRIISTINRSTPEAQEKP